MDTDLDSPLVTVLLPVYNGEKHLSDAIESVLNQTYKNFELLIINDCSTDSTDTIVKLYDDSRIRYLQHTENKRLIFTLNEGISLAKGKYLARLDADDIAFQTRIEEQVSFLEANLDYVLIGTKVQLIKEKQVTDETISYYTEDSDLRFSMCFYCPFIHPSIMLRLDVIRANNLLFDSNYLHAEDYEYWTRLSNYGKVGNINKILNYYRIHDEQISSVFQNVQIEQINHIRLKYLTMHMTEFTIEECTTLFKFESVSNLEFCYESFIKFLKSNTFDSPAKNRFIKKSIKNLILESTHIPFKIGFNFLFQTKNRENISLKQFFSMIQKMFRSLI